MLSKKSQTELLKMLRVADADITKLVDDDKENDVTLPTTIKVLDDTELTTRDANTKKEGVKEGEKNALTLAITEIGSKSGLTIDATKITRFGDLGTLLKDELGKTTDEKLKALNEQVSLLLKDKETLTTEAANAKNKAEKVEFEYGQFKNLPDNRSKANTESEYLMLLGSRGVEVKADGIYRNGEAMKDANTKANLPHAEAYKQLFTEFKWIAEAPAGATGGRGGGNSGGGAAGGKSTSFSAAQEKWLAANPNGNLVSPEADAFVRAEAKDNQAFNWNE